MSQVPAKYKKQDGKLSLSESPRTVSWKSSGAAPGPLSIAISDIINLQQTPATSANASVKVVVQKPGAAQPENHTFTFTSSKARDDQQATTATLRQWIEAAKAQTGATATPAPTPRPDGPSAAIPPAQAVSGVAKSNDESYEDSMLLADTALQQSLTNSNPELLQRFKQALQNKPESISVVQFSNQFWATRIHLLRSHAAESAQTPGTYNVLSVVKPKHENGALKLNMSKEQIHLIFVQHPLIKKVYNNLVPQLSEQDFWSRFFNSRLCKKLKGEKIVDVDPVDPKFDKYLNENEEADQGRQLNMETVPLFMDIEGNEQNHSQRLGNRQDWTMRPNAHDKVPILRALNRMSEKMMADVPPSDRDPHGPAGMDEETYKQLQLRDLQRADEDNRVVLRVQNQDQLFSVEPGLKTSSSASTYAQRTPAQALTTVQNDLSKLCGNAEKTSGLHLETAIGAGDESSSDEESEPKKQPKVGSRSTRAAATSQIMGAIRKRHLLDHEYFASQFTASTEQAVKLGLSTEVFTTLCMTHSTTVEFLHYFWTVFLSGDPDRALEVQKLAETLSKSRHRIDAVAKTAESERAKLVEKYKNDIEDHNKQAQKQGRKRRKFDPNHIKGGAKAVNDILHPLNRAIDAAVHEFKQVYALQSQNVQQLSDLP
ncbi:RNA polymerase II transcription factor [Amniculicola lignicola CBS 123094]|uniref:RNA polymerase II transcription factor n=1 Tax=Amniculicola lignicola CBS 123094 TaxID=1392246 RepID=A0A6A5WJF3_9PLEO|nr:RNA polymerase II transcription factor [Amniculicola lignicola CBS 123094]